MELQVFKNSEFGSVRSTIDSYTLLLTTGG